MQVRRPRGSPVHLSCSRFSETGGSHRRDAWSNLQSYEKVALNQFFPVFSRLHGRVVSGGPDPITPEVPLCKSNFLSPAFQLFSWFS